MNKSEEKKDGNGYGRKEAEINRQHEEVTQQCRQAEVERKRQNLEVNAEAGPDGRPKTPEIDPELSRFVYRGH
ncbi:hypothetical protein CEXT_349041, partial [Caerostris extrusa]